jgi:hypothetical protein
MRDVPRGSTNCSSFKLFCYTFRGEERREEERRESEKPQEEAKELFTVRKSGETIFES